MVDVIQTSFLPDNDAEPTVKRASVPLVRLVDGRYLWKAINRDDYEVQPDLERVLLSAIAQQKGKNA